MSDLKIGVTGHAYIADTTEQAREEFYPYYSNYWGYVNKQRGMSTPYSSLGFRTDVKSRNGLIRG